MTNLTPPSASADNVLGTLAEATVTYHDSKELRQLAHDMFTLYTEDGLPPDMFISEFQKRQELPKLAWVFVISEYQRLFLEHRRQSGLNEKRLEPIRRRNREDIERYITKGELGVY